MYSDFDNELPSKDGRLGEIQSGEAGAFALESDDVGVADEPAELGLAYDEDSEELKLELARCCRAGCLRFGMGTADEDIPRW